MYIRGLARVSRGVGSARVLRRAVGWYAENRVLLDGDRTIIFK